MNINNTHRVFGLLLTFLVANAQVLAVNGGPYELGAVSDPYRLLDGTYSMTLIPEENLLEENIDDTSIPVSDLASYDPKNPGSALGFAYFLAPAGGVARGSIGLFYNGRLMIGNIAGSLRMGAESSPFLPYKEGKTITKTVRKLVCPPNVTVEPIDTTPNPKPSAGLLSLECPTCPHTPKCKYVYEEVTEKIPPQGSKLDGTFTFLAQMLAPSPDVFQAFDVASSNTSSTGTSTPTGGGGAAAGNNPGAGTGQAATTPSTNSTASQSSVTTVTTQAGGYADGQISGKASVQTLRQGFSKINLVTLDGRATIRIVNNPDNVLGSTSSEEIVRFYVTGARQSTETDFSADAVSLPFWVNSLSNTNLSLTALNRNTSAATQPTNTNQPDRLPALPANATTTANDQRRITPGSASFIQTLFRPISN